MATIETLAGPARPGAGRRAAIGAVAAAVLAVFGLFLFFATATALAPRALSLALPDNDDMMRLVAVRDLLAGQAWFDLTQHRYRPPDGVLMHWSRLVDLPLAAGIAGLAPLAGVDSAERAIVVFWPLLMFLAYAGVTGWGAWRLFGSLAAGVAVFTAGQMVVFAYLFAPGRIDHHNVQAILVAGAAIGFGLGGRWAILSGVLAGLSLAIGLETLPFVACIAAAYALAWVMRGGEAAGPFTLFAIGAGVTALAAFALTTPPRLWFLPACDALSAPWLLLVACGAAAAVALAALTPRLASPAWRLGGLGIAAGLPLLAFVALYPDCLGGPYHMVPEPFRSTWLANISEASPFREFLSSRPRLAAQYLGPMLVGAVAATLGAWRGAGAKTATLALLAALMWLGIVLAQYQIRTVYIASAFLPLVAGWFVAALAERRPLIAGARIPAFCATALLFGLPWTLAVEALGIGASKAALPPVAAAPSCRSPDAVGALDRLPAGLVFGPRQIGSNILLYTRHSIVTAGYHRAPDGIVAAITAFSGDEGTMRRAVAESGADYLVICPHLLPEDAGEARSFAKVLVEGGSAAWLEPVGLGDTPLLAWRVTVDR